MAIKVNVKMNHAAIGRLSTAQKQALEMTAEAVKSDVTLSAMVPKQAGELERSAFIDTSKLSKGKTRLGYDTPYARRLYWHPEYDFRTDKNASAQGKWLQTYIDGAKRNFAKEAFRKLYRKLTGGVVK
ncbi:hypothetical protein LY28_00020 [Ruminiclostridium sufflavum DSM 19573]|uniref:Minor capsid protein n=1 Tax=Ruminiclostridium sufflavum DSM 19573 TaxID=1121337 RepID=A0A318XU28_9FIRM|nr:hypothetical protein [Ruminiclostridium sufflavum]PYG90140.1 hypothetical protein LY28_00020 [Ruminiclostridium sufflavum DSM 19573]